MFDVDVSNRIARVGMNHAPANAISPAWCDELGVILDALESRNDWSILHIRSHLRHFSVGADLQLIREGLGNADAGEKLANAARKYQQLFSRIEAMPQVTLAEIAGAAVGGGLELALACDLRLAGEEVSIGLPEARLGLVPGAGGTQRLTRLCGKGVAARLILGAEIVTGAVARDLGIVQWAVPHDQLEASANEITRRIASNPPEALFHAKQCIRAAHFRNDEGYELELKATANLASSIPTREAISDFLRGRNQKAGTRDQSP